MCATRATAAAALHLFQLAEQELCRNLKEKEHLTWTRGTEQEKKRCVKGMQSEDLDAGYLSTFALSFERQKGGRFRFE